MCVIIIIMLSISLGRKSSQLPAVYSVSIKLRSQYVYTVVCSESVHTRRTLSCTLLYAINVHPSCVQKSVHNCKRWEPKAGHISMLRTVFSSLMCHMLVYLKLHNKIYQCYNVIITNVLIAMSQWYQIIPKYISLVYIFVDPLCKISSGR